MFKFELGDTVKEKITGFEGVIMGRTEYITGCRQYGILHRKLKDGRPQDWMWIDEERLKIAGPRVQLDESIGGPQPTAPSR